MSLFCACSKSSTVTSSGGGANIGGTVLTVKGAAR
jgi:hypothetical protein